jgi:hypothetical protein
MADINSIGTIMIQLMEPASIFLDRKPTVLKEPDKWSDESGIKAFLAAAQQDYSSLSQLRAVSLSIEKG